MRHIAPVIACWGFAALAGCSGDSGSEGPGFVPYQSPANDGASPTSLIQGSDGNFYGTTLFGGQFDYGTVFRITPLGGETVVYSFAGGTDGAYPSTGLVEIAGNLYGTTYDATVSSPRSLPAAAPH